MRRSLPLVVLTGALILNACGSDEDSTTSTTVEAATATTVPATTIAVDPLACFDATAEIDLAEYPEGEIPPAIRPCALPTELAVTVIRPGTGREAAAGDKLIMDYTGIRSIDGTSFDNSYSRGTPFEFALATGRVIAGWDQGFVGVQAGSVIRLDIPAELAYGDTPRGDVIQPGDPLTFVVEVRAVVKLTTEADTPSDLQVETSEGATEVTTIDVRVGEGPVAQQGQTALIHFMIVRGDNRVILGEPTWANGQPAPLPLDSEAGSLPGLIAGIQGMQVGGMRVITMPASEAFGEEGNTSIGLPAATDVIFVTELVGLYGTPTEGAPGTTVPNVVSTTTPTTSTTIAPATTETTAPGTSEPGTTTP